MMALASRAELAQSRGDVSAVGSWESRGDAFIRPIRFQQGWIQVDAAPLMQEIRKLLAAVAPQVAAELSRALVPAAQAAFDAWPVGVVPKPVHSKDRVGLEYAILGPTTWQASLVNRAEYALFIRRGSTARSLIFERGTRAADLAARRLETVLGRG
jgi:hypothetical protein